MAASSLSMKCSIARPSVALARRARAQKRLSSAARRHATVAKYGDKSVYFDLEDVEQTTGQWEMYAVDGDQRYPEWQSEFFEKAADPLTKRETVLSLAALIGSLCVLSWGFNTRSLDLPINKGPSKPPVKGPRGKI